MEKKLDELKTRLFEINDLEMATAVLSWDQSTYMPAGGAPARARQIATVVCRLRPPTRECCAGL